MNLNNKFKTFNTLYLQLKILTVLIFEISLITKGCKDKRLENLSLWDKLNSQDYKLSKFH